MALRLWMELVVCRQEPHPVFVDRLWHATTLQCLNAVEAGIQPTRIFGVIMMLIGRFNLKTKPCFALSHGKCREKAFFFFLKVFDLQWKGKYSQVVWPTQIQSGFSASIHWLSHAFLAARNLQRPFQINLEDDTWLHGPTDQSSWAHCEPQDIACYYLPISNYPQI